MLHHRIASWRPAQKQQPTSVPPRTISYAVRVRYLVCDTRQYGQYGGCGPWLGAALWCALSLQASFTIPNFKYLDANTHDAVDWGGVDDDDDNGGDARVASTKTQKKA